MTELRVVSFLPAATEMMFALGLDDALVGVSHECDFPAAARTKPVVVKPALSLDGMSSREIDATVAARICSGQSLYEVDEQLLEDLAPTHIFTQNLCQVCAPSGNEISRALAALPAKPQVLWFTPRCIEDIFGNLRELGAATGRLIEADNLIAASRARLRKVAEATKTARHTPRVFVLEWTDPHYCCGHWVPEMVELAGGEDKLGRKGADSVRISWAGIAGFSPEVIIVSPCGLGLDAAIDKTNQLLRQPGWDDLPAAPGSRIFAVDANAYFARPGPRIVDGVELLAHMIHPELFEWRGPDGAFRRFEAANRTRRPGVVNGLRNDHQIVLDTAP